MELATLILVSISAVASLLTFLGFAGVLYVSHLEVKDERKKNNK